jgi:hypothetical protein
MSEDRRGFVYPLEPVRLQAQWHLDELQRELAASSARLATLRGDSATLTSRHGALAREARAAATQPIDPARALQRLAYLGDLQRRLAALAEETTEAQAGHATLLQRAAAARVKLDTIERDSERALREHAQDRARANAVAADQDWLARSEWRRTNLAAKEAG